MERYAAFCLVFVVAACGGGSEGGGGSDSGVSGNKRVVDLTDAELGQLCEWSVHVLDAPREVQCEGDVSVTLNGVDECVASYQSVEETCELTVSQMERCALVLAADPCNGFGHSACQPVLECAF